jgi:hypothetical protein
MHWRRGVVVIKSAIGTEDPGSNPAIIFTKHLVTLHTKLVRVKCIQTRVNTPLCKFSLRCPCSVVAHLTFCPKPVKNKCQKQLSLFEDFIVVLIG